MDKELYPIPANIFTLSERANKVKEVKNMEIFTVDQAAEILALCPKTIRDMLKTGRMHGSKIGGKWRITRADIDELITSNRR